MNTGTNRDQKCHIPLELELQVFLRYQHDYREPSTGPLKEQRSLLTAEPSFLSLSWVVLNANLESPGKRACMRTA